MPRLSINARADRTASLGGTTKKAVTLHQPYASLIALKVKRFETRTWPTKHRGPIAIHAGMKLHKEVCEVFNLNPTDLPLGAIVAYADVVDCIQMTGKRDASPWL
ncbi:ASCH domain-containing protein [Lyngbya sp. CCAP 1446/10]|uniref:ASCH domain-containing protein n=1 Tax=Lyngbya sp. CCAP 1446/10 TaxID=439293 RepID=UPI002AA2B55F|nr:ASCH domain-containing protein [Lyngbya sp. CCAP 1446/10]MCW6051296.1 ASCH domain-containing protein [Lyngbya sp. CCAP 1446/10]